MSDELKPVEAFLDSYAAAVGDRDVDGFMRLYADEVVVFDVWEQAEYAAVMRGLRSWGSGSRR